MAKCRKNGRGKKMEDEDIQKLQQQHQQQRQRKEQSNSNIDRDQSRPPPTVMANPFRSERHGNKERDEKPRSLEQSRKVENQHTGKKEVAVLSAIDGSSSTGGSTIMVADTNTENVQKRPVPLKSLPTTEEPPVGDGENEGVADEEPLQAPAAAPTVATVVDTAPADPRGALLGAIKSRRRDDDGNSEDHAPADRRVALLGAIRSRDIVGGVDPRKAMLSAIEARRKD